MRTCIGCGGRFPQPTLVRYRVEDRSLVLGPGPGRSVYTCADEACVRRAVARGAFPRRLRSAVQVPPDLPERIAAATPATGSAPLPRLLG